MLFYTIASDGNGTHSGINVPSLLKNGFELVNKDILTVCASQFYVNLIQPIVIQEERTSIEKARVFFILVVDGVEPSQLWW